MPDNGATDQVGDKHGVPAAIPTSDAKAVAAASHAALKAAEPPAHRHAPSLVPWMRDPSGAVIIDDQDGMAGARSAVDQMEAAVAQSSHSPSSHRHAVSQVPWNRGDDTDVDTEAGVDLPSRSARRGAPTEAGEDRRRRFASGDFRKPQLSRDVAGPLTDRTRRRSGSHATSGRRASGDQPTAVANANTRPSAIQTAAVVSAADQRVLDERRAAIVAVVTARGLLRGLDGRVMALFGLVTGVATLLLPSAPGAPPLWQAMSDASEAAWPLGLTLGAVATLLSLGLILVAFAGGGLRDSNDEDATPDGGGVFAAFLGLLALILRDGAVPGSVSAAMSPMRGDLLGVPAALWYGIAAASLLTIGRRADERPARLVGLLASLALIVTFWQPIVWLGATTLPILAALTGAAGIKLDMQMVTAPVLSAPLGVILGALVGPACLAMLLLPKTPARGALDGMAAGLLAVGIFVAVSGAGTGGMAALGAGLAVASTMALVAAATLAILIRLGDRFDEDTGMMLEGLAVGTAIAVFLVLKLNGGRFSATDEGIYFYTAKAWADGIWPYHDFFFSHPPLHVLPLAMLFLVFGWSWVIAKSMSVVAALVTGIVVWRIVRRWYGPLCGIFGMIFFLFAAETLKASTNLTGINLTTMWLTLALWASLRDRFFLAGVAAGTAIGTGLYAAGGALVLFALLAFAPQTGETRGRALAARLLSQPALIFLVGVVLVFGSVHFIGTLVGDGEFTKGVYDYHMLKAVKTPGYIPPSEGPIALIANTMAMLQSRDFMVTLYYHGAHWWLALLAPLGLVASLALRRSSGRPAANDLMRGPAALADPDRWAQLWNPRRWWLHLSGGGTTMIVWILALGLTGELAQFRERYDFYFVLVIPSLAILASATLHGLYVVARSAVGAGNQDADLAAASSLQGGVKPAPSWTRPALAAALVVCALWVPIAGAANRAAFASEIIAAGDSRGAGERLSFEWVDTPGPSVLSDATRHLLWKDWRVRGNLESGVHHYLWSKKRWFSTAEEIAEAVADRALGNETITGASTFAPMVALLAGRRMAGDEVDTNAKTFKTGAVSERAFWRQACADHLRFIIAAPHSWFTPASVQRMPTVTRHFKMVREFRDPKLKHWRDEVIQLWERVGSADCVYVDSHGVTDESPVVPSAAGAIGDAAAELAHPAPKPIEVPKARKRKHKARP